ncbi:MAG: hypothetical protein ACFFB3_10585 [Candidatus Hodarchaeota archaeon]
MKRYRGVLRLPNLSPIVQQVLEDWMAMIQLIRNPVPNQSPILANEELKILDRFRSQLEMKFPDSPEIEKIERDLQAFRSVRLFGITKGFSLLFPWTFYIEARYGAAVQILAITARNMAHFPSLRNLPQFVDFVARTCYDFPVPLTHTAVKLLRALTNPPQSGTNHGFPTYGDFAQAANCSERSVTNFMTIFLQRTVASPRYLINMGQLGFKCWQIEHNNDLPEGFHSYIMRCYPLFPKNWLSVLYLPEDYPLNILKQVGDMTLIQNHQINWNLAQLTKDSELSWREPVRLLGEYSGVIPSPQKGINFFFTEKSPFLHLNKDDFRILDQLQLTAASYDEIATNLNLKRRFVAEHIDLLVKQNVLVPYYNLSRIGLTSSLLLKWGDNDSWNEGLMDNLRAFPYSELFVNPKGGNAVLKIPSSWTSQILRDVMNLRNEEYDIWAVLCIPRIARWGLSLTEIAEEFDHFFGWKWRNTSDSLSKD